MTARLAGQPPPLIQGLGFGGGGWTADVTGSRAAQAALATEGEKAKAKPWMGDPLSRIQPSTGNAGHTCYVM